MRDNPILYTLLLNPRYRIFRHLVLLLCCGIMGINNGYLEFRSSPDPVFVVVLMLVFFIPVYVNVCWLVPRFLLRNRYTLYLSLVSGTILVVVSCTLFIQLAEKNAFLHDIDKEIVHNPGMAIINILSGILSIGLLIAGSSAVLLIRHWIICGQRIDALVSATMKSELDQLKNQINPHFLFNMLNNANVLTKENPGEARRVIFRLKDLLEYQLKESLSESVRLTNEIRFLTDFLNLEKIRRDNFEYDITTEGNIETVGIPPLLFIPFVENAVKHNNDNGILSYVRLRFKVDGGTLSFTCTNSKPSVKRESDGGLGLANITRRLQLLYNDTYTLHINENEITYTIYLCLKL